MVMSIITNPLSQKNRKVSTTSAAAPHTKKNYKFLVKMEKSLNTEFSFVYQLKYFKKKKQTTGFNVIHRFWVLLAISEHSERLCIGETRGQFYLTKLERL